MRLSSRLIACALVLATAALGSACEQKFVLATGGSSHSASGSTSSATGSTGAMSTTGTATTTAATTTTTTTTGTSTTSGGASINCGGPICMSPNSCCRKIGAPGTCGTTCNPSTEKLSCGGSEDCPNNGVCCYVVGSGSSCQSTCSGVEFCHSACPPGKSCAPYASFSGINACM